MVNETSTTNSTSADASLVKDSVVSTTATTSTISNAASLSPAHNVQGSNMMSNELLALENRLQTKIDAAAKTGGSTGLLWFVVAITLAAGGAAGYTAFQNQQKLNSLESNYLATQNKLDLATIKIEEKASLLATAQAQNAQFMQGLGQVQEQSNDLANAVNSLSSNQENLAQNQQLLQQKVEQYADRNPDDWKLAESFFLVNNANQKAVYEKNIKAALWLLQSADDLLSQVVSQDDKIIELRNAISQDKLALQNINEVDMIALGLELDRAYDNVDNLVLKGYSDPAVRAAAFKPTTQPTGAIADWKDNLLQSAQDFSSRFIEIRRRDANAATEFLTPAQDVYLRENIKTRILLAKNNLAHGEKEAMQSNLNEALKLINTYFDEKSKITETTVETLNNLANAQISIETPQVLSSTPLFAKFVHKQLSGK